MSVSSRFWSRCTAAVVMVWCTATVVAPAGAAPVVVSAASSAPTAVDAGVANASDQDVQQGVTVIDRTTGQVLASANGDTVYNSESILKLFTAAFYLAGADGAPDTDLLETLKPLIEVSDNGIQSDLWDVSIVPTIIERYGLTGSTRNANNASSRNWGSGKITADDQARFLYAMSQDPEVGPFLMPLMAAAAPTGSDGYNQLFGLNAMAGDHGSKQGWSDPGWEPYNVHSVGWTGQYFVAILQTSYTASSTTMRETSTYTATLMTQAMNEAYPAPAPPAATSSSEPDPSSVATSSSDPGTSSSSASVTGCRTVAGWLSPAAFGELTAAISAVVQGRGAVWCPAG